MNDDIPIGKLVENDYNPRKHFDDAQMKELEKSIRNQGIVQAITIRPLEGGKYEIVAGTRRFIAAKNAGLKKIPAMILELSDEQAMLLSITENLERSELTPIEEARAFKAYLGWDGQKAFEGDRQEGLRQLVDKLSEQLPISDATIYHRLSLLHLPESLKIRVEQNTLKIKIAETIAGLRGLWKIKTTGMSDEEIDENRDTIRAEIHKVMEVIADTVEDEDEARKRVNQCIEAEQMNLNQRDALAGKQKEALDKAEKALIAFFDFIERFPENWGEINIKQRLDWVKLHIETNIRKLSDEELEEVSKKRALLGSQHDRYIMNLTYVKELTLDICPHCGAGISIEFLERRIGELQEEMNALSESEKGLGNELSTWRERKKSIEKLGRNYTTAKSTYDASMNTTG